MSQIWDYRHLGFTHWSVILDLKPCTDIASNLFAIDLRLNVQIACDGLQQKFQHAEYFTYDPLISQSILI